MALSVTSAPWQQVNMPALDLRRWLYATGVQEGIRSSTDLTVVQRGAGANMSVDVGVGFAMVQGDSVTNQGLFLAYNDAATNAVVTAAHATLPRIDRVCVRVRDAFHGDAANDISFQVVAGTATSGATLVNLNGAAAVPASHLLLANVLVGAAVSSITNANIANVAQQSGAASLPTGTEIELDSDTAPTGFLLLDGTAVSRTSYAALFNHYGTRHGTGDGSTTFNLPNRKGRVAVSKDAAQTEFDTLAETGGAKTHALTTAELAAHSHGVTDPGHFHQFVATFSTGAAGNNSAWEVASQGPGTAGNTFSATTGISTQNAGGGNAHNNLQPYYVINRFVKT